MTEIQIKHFTIKETLHSVFEDFNNALAKAGQNFFYEFDIEIQKKEIGSGLIIQHAPVTHEGVIRVIKKHKHNKNREKVLLTFNAPLLKSSVIEGTSEKDIATCEIILMKMLLKEAVGTFLLTSEQILKAKTGDHAKG